MTDIIVGSVAVGVVPSAKGFPEKLRAELVPASGKIGDEIGTSISNRVVAAGSGTIKKWGDTQKAPAAAAGSDAGTNFAKTFKDKVTAILKNLPDAKIGADTTEVDNRIEAVRQELSKLGDKKIGIDANTISANEKIDGLKRDLSGLVDKRFNIEANTAKANTQIEGIKKELSVLGNKRIGVDISDDAALGKLDELKQRLLAVQNESGTVTMHANIDKAVSSIGVLSRDIAHLKTGVTVPIDANAAPAKTTLQDINERLASYGKDVATAKADVNSKSAREKLGSVERELIKIGHMSADPTIGEHGLQSLDIRLMLLKSKIDDINHKPVDVKTSGASGLIGLASDLAGVSKEGTAAAAEGHKVALAMLALNLATGIAEPVVSALVVTLGATAAAAVGAGIGLGGFALVAKQQITGVTTALTAQSAAQAANKLAAETTGKAQVAAQAAAAKATAAYKIALKSLDPPQRALFEGISKVRTEFTAWSKSLAGPVLAPLTKGLQVVNPLLKDMTPFVKAAASAMSELVDKLIKAVHSSGFAEWLKAILPLVKPAIEGIGSAIGHIVVGIGGILKAFAPFSKQIIGGIDDITKKFAKWGTTLSGHSGFQSLLGEWKQNWPGVKKGLDDFIVIIKNIVSGMSGLATGANSKWLWQIADPILAVVKALSGHPLLLDLFLYIILAAKVSGKITSMFDAAKSGWGAITKVLTLITGGKVNLGMQGAGDTMLTASKNMQAAADKMATAGTEQETAGTEEESAGAEQGGGGGAKGLLGKLGGTSAIAGVIAPVVAAVIGAAVVYTALKGLDSLISHSSLEKSPTYRRDVKTAVKQGGTGKGGLALSSVTALVDPAEGWKWLEREFPHISGAIIDFWNKSQKDAGHFFTFIKQSFQRDVIDTIGHFFSVSFPHFFTHTIPDIFKPVTHGLATAIDWIKSNWRRVPEIIKSGIETAINWVKARWKDITGGLATAINWIHTNWNKIPGILKAGVETAINWVKARWKDITGGLATAINWIRTNWNKIPGILRAGIETAINWVKARWKDITGGLATVITWIRTNWNKIPGILRAGIQAVVTWIEGRWTAMTGVFRTAINAIKTIWSAAWTWVKQAFTGAWNAVVGAVKTGWNAVTNAFHTGVNTIKTVWNAIWNWVKSAFNSAWNAVVGAVKTGWTAVTNAFHTGVNAIKSVWNTVWNDIKSIVTTVINWIKNFLNTAWNDIKSTTATVWNAIKGFFGTWINNFRSAWNDVVSWVKGFLNTAWNDIKNVAISVWDDIKGFFGTWINNFRSAWNDVVGWVKGFLNTAWNDIKNVAISVWDDIKGFFSSWINNFRSGWSAIVAWVKGFLNTAWNDIKNVVISVWDQIKNFFTTWINNFRTGWNTAVSWIKNTLSSAWNTISSTARNVWNGILGFFRTIWSGLKTGFTGAVKAVKQIWHGIETAVQVPVKFVINDVYDPIARIVNDVSKFVNLGSPMPIVHMAQGGVVPGRDHGIDEVPAMLRPTERVLSTDQVAALGGHKNIDALVGPGSPVYHNGIMYAQGGGKATPQQGGGGNSRFGPHPTPGWNPITSIEHAAGDIWHEGERLIKGAFVKTIEPALNFWLSKESKLFGEGPWAKDVAQVPAIIVKDIESWLVSEDAKYAAIGGGSGNEVAKYAKSYATGKNHPYVTGGANPRGWDCSGFSAWVYNKFHFFKGGKQGTRFGTSESQYADRADLKRAKPQAGALVFFNDGVYANPGHVGVMVNSSDYAGADDQAVGTIVSSAKGGYGHSIPKDGFPGAGGGKFSGGVGGAGLYSYLMNNVFDSVRVASTGALAAMWGESGWNPESVGDGGCGLMGWNVHSPGNQLTTYGGTCHAAGIGHESTSQDFTNQLHAISEYIRPDSGTIQAMKRASTVLAAANLWGTQIERFGINDVHSAGIAAAEAIAAAAGGGKPVGTTPSGGGKPGSGHVKGPGHAAGTPWAKPGWSWVGELGPELVKFNGGEVVVPSHQSIAQAMAGGINLPGYSAGTDASLSKLKRDQKELKQNLVDQNNMEGRIKADNMALVQLKTELAGAVKAGNKPLQAIIQKQIDNFTKSITHETAVLKALKTAALKLQAEIAQLERTPLGRKEADLKQWTKILQTNLVDLPVQKAWLRNLEKIGSADQVKEQKKVVAREERLISEAKALIPKLTKEIKALKGAPAKAKGAASDAEIAAGKKIYAAGRKGKGTLDAEIPAENTLVASLKALLKLTNLSGPDRVKTEAKLKTAENTLKRLTKNKLDLTAYQGSLIASDKILVAQIAGAKSEDMTALAAKLTKQLKNQQSMIAKITAWIGGAAAAKGTGASSSSSGGGGDGGGGASGGSSATKSAVPPVGIMEGIPTAISISGVATGGSGASAIGSAIGKAIAPAVTGGMFGSPGPARSGMFAQLTSAMVAQYMDALKKQLGHVITFDTGGKLMPHTVSTLFNGTGKAEPILNDQQWNSMHTLAKRGGSMDTKALESKLDRLIAVTGQTGTQFGRQLDGRGRLAANRAAYPTGGGPV